MMNNFIKISAASALALAASCAVAASGDVYAGLSAGYSMHSTSDVEDGEKISLKGKGFAGDVLIGYYLTDEIRADFSVTFSPSNKMNEKNTVTGDKTKNVSKLSTYTFLANAYYDINTGSAITPYVTLGFGGASVTDKDTANSSSLSTGHFAYQAGLGVSYEVTSGVAVDLGYRLTGLLKSKYRPITSNSFLIGARFSF